VIKDVDAFARHVSEKFGIPIENMTVLAHSLAAVTIAAWIHDYAPPIRAMILATPAFHVKLYIPFAIPALRILRPRFVKSYVKSKMLTHDREQAARYDSDRLIFRQIAVNVLLDLHDTSKRLLADAGAIQTPTLMIGAGKDWVVSLPRRLSRDLSRNESPRHYRTRPRVRSRLLRESGNRAFIGKRR
jgi:alpha-beta hydrolase superfamily lysophospholipase